MTEYRNRLITEGCRFLGTSLVTHLLIQRNGEESSACGQLLIESCNPVHICVISGREITACQ